MTQAHLTTCMAGTLTCSPTWETHLNAMIQRLRRTPPRVAVVGIGRETSGDDAVGLHVVRALLPSDTFYPVEAGIAPENVTGALRDFDPDGVLLVDAAALNQPAGTVAWLGTDELPALAGFGASTHGYSLALLVWYLRESLGCEVALIAVQIAQTVACTPDASLSAPVEVAAHSIAATLARSFCSGCCVHESA